MAIYSTVSGIVCLLIRELCIFLFDMSCVIHGWRRTWMWLTMICSSHSWCCICVHHFVFVGFNVFILDCIHSVNRMICSLPEIIGCVAQLVLVDHQIPDPKSISSSLVTFKKFLLLMNQLHCCIFGLWIFVLVAGGLRQAMISIHLLIYIHNHNKSNSVSLK